MIRKHILAERTTGKTKYTENLARNSTSDVTILVVNGDEKSKTFYHEMRQPMYERDKFNIRNLSDGLTIVSFSEFIEHILGNGSNFKNAIIDKNVTIIIDEHFKFCENLEQSGRTMNFIKLIDFIEHESCSFSELIMISTPTFSIKLKFYMDYVIKMNNFNGGSVNDSKYETLRALHILPKYLTKRFDNKFPIKDENYMNRPLEKILSEFSTNFLKI